MEDEIKEILGDDYVEGMSGSDLTTALQNKFGNADMIKKLQEDKKKLQNDIKNLRPESEKKEIEIEEKNQQIEEIRAELEAQKLNSAKNIASAKISTIKDMAGIDEKEIKKMVDEFSTSDIDKTTTVVDSVINMIKKSYEKGQADSSKNELGKMGNLQGGSSEEGSNSFGKMLAQQSISKLAENESRYFQRK